jgi:hypothetical protein
LRNRHFYYKSPEFVIIPPFSGNKNPWPKQQKRRNQRIAAQWGLLSKAALNGCS